MKLAIVGISGRMGIEVIELAPEFNFEVTAGVSKKKSSGAVRIVDEVSALKAEECDVVIDFSLPLLTEVVAKWCADHCKPLVSGVTGVNTDQILALQAAGLRAPVLWSPNMSLGVAVLARMLPTLSLLDSFDFQIEEVHHAQKKDKPSGTALMLQKALADAVKKPLPEPVSIRGGGVSGIHRIWAMGAEETISLEHTAMNRRVFARGALRAAAWLKVKPPGFYRIDDVLGV